VRRLRVSGAARRNDAGAHRQSRLGTVHPDRQPDSAGRQQTRECYAVGAPSGSDLEAVELGVGWTADAFALARGGSAWFGPAGDPFWGDGVTLFAFHQALAENRYAPELFTADGGNLFAGRNVTAIALRIPDAMLGGTEVAVWARISLHGHAPQRQVSRMGNPMLRPPFFPQPGPETEALNAGSPTDDIARFGEAVRRTAAHVAKLRDAADPDEHAAALVNAFLPDVLRYRPGQPARFAPGTGNGRALHDDAFGTALSLLVGDQLGVSAPPHPRVPKFPHLLATAHEDIPALADLFGLREHAPQSQAD